MTYLFHNNNENIVSRHKCRCKRSSARFSATVKLWNYERNKSFIFSNSFIEGIFLNLTKFLCLKLNKEVELSSLTRSPQNVERRLREAPRFGVFTPYPVPTSLLTR